MIYWKPVHSFLILIAALFFLACHSSKKVSDEVMEQQALTAKKNGDWLQAAQLFETIYERNPTNEQANYEAGTHYLKANHLEKGLMILKKFDRQYENKAADFNGRVARLAKAYNKTGQYAEVQNLVDQYEYPKMYRGLAREHLKSLIQLQEKEALDQSFVYYQQTGIYDDKGKNTNLGFLYRAICNELLLVGNQKLLKLYATSYADWATKRLPKDKRNWAIATFYQQRYSTAISHLQEAIAQEDAPRHQLELIGLLGICYAKEKMPTLANKQLIKINSFPTLPPRHDAFGAIFYHQARIELALEKIDAAIQSLQKALEHKAEFWSNRFAEDGLLQDVLGHAAFERLVRSN